MNLCFMCDIHLPYNMGTSQYNAFDWACEIIKKGRKNDVIIIAGDFTANGDINAAKYFKHKLSEFDIPVITMIGNSDLRTPETCDYIKALRSPSKNVIDGKIIYALDDGDRTVKDSDIKELYNLDSSAIIVMHHPIEDLLEPSKKKMLKWRESHCKNLLFCAHKHIGKIDGYTIYLQALDPDKATGNGPCITHYDTKTNIASDALYLCPPPKDIYDYVGISCFYPKEDINYATQNNIKCIELRDTATECDFNLLAEKISKWRTNGGKNLSMHAPEISIEDARAKESEAWNKFISLAKILHPERITLHTPKVSVKYLKANPDAMNIIISFLSITLSELENSCVIGVENMHMTSQDSHDDSRRFGYIPEEVMFFSKQLGMALKQKVGINFDTGHARNNAPYSQKYTVGAWYKETGKHTVGYHIHQVILEDGKFYNHMPIDHVHGSLISCASFFDCWNNGIINKAPIICEIRGNGEQGAYKSTLNMFERLKAFWAREDDD